MLEYIRLYHSLKGYSPSIGEIANHLDTSKSIVVRYLDQLQADGLLKRDPGIARSIVLIRR